MNPIIIPKMTIIQVNNPSTHRYLNPKKIFHIIQLNTIRSDLTYIYVPEINASFLVDTGSSRSLINPKLAYHYYNHFISKENFYIQTAHGVTFYDEVAEIPIFEIFKTTGKHKFYLIYFSKKYDGLIGIDMLKQLNANVNFSSEKIERPNVKIPFIFEEKQI